MGSYLNLPMQFVIIKLEIDSYNNCWVHESVKQTVEQQCNWVH